MSLLPAGGPLWLWLGLAGVFGLTAVFARDGERREAAYRVLLAFLPWARRSPVPSARSDFTNEERELGPEGDDEQASS